MNATAGNIHFTFADALSSESPHGNILEAKLAQAQVEATLALAYEQRTANLIGILNGRAFIPMADYQALEKTVLERLDIDAEPTK